MVTFQVMTSIYRTATVALLCSMLFALVINWPEYARMQAPAFIGSFIGGTLGLWGFSGVFMVFAKPENKIWIWLVVLTLVGGVSWIGKLEDRKSGWRPLPGGGQVRQVR